MTKKGLILLAGIVWGVAGINVARRGVATWLSLEHPGYPLLFAGALATFVVFGIMFFRLTKKNLRRIAAFERERNPFWMFMSLKSYLIMTFMISLGVVLRNYTSTPRTFIAPFYVGLGTALLLAGIAYFLPDRILRVRASRK